jgi:hypothetical protein
MEIFEEARNPGAVVQRYEATLVSITFAQAPGFKYVIEPMDQEFTYC